MNNWNFTGNIGRDAEQRHTAGGDSVVSFSVGVKAGYGDKASTVWANCTLFGKRGESIISYLLKGQLVGVSGEVAMREWQDKEGQRRTSLDVRVNDVTLLGKRDDKPAQKPQDKPANLGDFADDIPF